MWTINAFEKTFKRSLCMALKKIDWTVFSIQTLPRPKIALLNLDIHQFSYSERLIHMKRHLKRSLFIEFKENPLSHFSFRESLPKPEIGILNLDFCQCYCGKRLFCPEWYLKGNNYNVRLFFSIRGAIIKKIKASFFKSFLDHF